MSNERGCSETADAIARDVGITSREHRAAGKNALMKMVVAQKTLAL